MGNGRCLGQGSDRLDLNELMGVTQHRDTQQCAGWVVVTKVAPDHTPGRVQIFAAVADDVDGGFDHVGQFCLGGLQRDAQVGHDALGLTGDIPDGDDDSVLVEGTGPSGDDQSADVVGHGGVGVGHRTGQRRGADELNRGPW